MVGSPVSDRTVGVSIGIPEPYGSQLERWRERLGDPNAGSVPPHITLVPPTLLHSAELDEVEEHLSDVAQGFESFDVHLRGSGSFRPISPVVFVPLATGVSDCERLEKLVHDGPLRGDRRFPYHPHVTVAHDLGGAALDRAYAALASFDALFSVWGFSLFEQGVDGVWRPLRDFPFGRPLPGPHEQG